MVVRNLILSTRNKSLKVLKRTLKMPWSKNRKMMMMKTKRRRKVKMKRKTKMLSSMRA